MGYSKQISSRDLPLFLKPISKALSSYITRHCLCHLISDKIWVLSIPSGVQVPCEQQAITPKSILPCVKLGSFLVKPRGSNRCKSKFARSRTDLEKQIPQQTSWVEEWNDRNWCWEECLSLSLLYMIQVWQPPPPLKSGTSVLLHYGRDN